MPRRSAVESLPKAVKAWLDQALVEGNFSGYAALEAELRERGYAIGKSSLQRYGSQFEERLAALKLASEQARAVAESLPDDENALSDTLIRLVQQKAFDMLMKLEGDPKASFGTLGRLAVETGAVTIRLRKYQAEVRAKAKDAARAVVKLARKGGISDEAIREMEERVLRIAQ